MSEPTAIILKDVVDGKIKEFLIDASLSLNTSLSANVTSYPVEDGKFISDHVQPAPLKLRIVGVISQSPDSTLLSVINAGAGFIAGQVSSLKGLSSAFASAAIASGIAGLTAAAGKDLKKDASFVKLLNDRNVVDNEFPKRAMLGLVGMFNSGTPFKVRTFFSDVLYDNMVATSIAFPQDAKSGDSLRFTLECVKVNIVQTKINIGGKSELDASDPVGSSAAPSSDKGTVDGKEILESDTGILKSISNSIFN